jgi:hypothetical protein
MLHRRLIVTLAGAAGEAFGDEWRRSRWHYLRQEEDDHLKAKEIIREACNDGGLKGLALRKWIKQAFLDAACIVGTEIGTIIDVQYKLEECGELQDAVIQGICWPGLHPLSEEDWKLA